MCCWATKRCYKQPTTCEIELGHTTALQSGLCKHWFADVLKMEALGNSRMYNWWKTTNCLMKGLFPGNKEAGTRS